MNANELADELDYCYGKEYPCPVSKEAATMLRQQQAEIEALKKDNKELHAISQRMAMAESDARKSLQWFKDAKERQSEPVAWMSVELNGRTVLATYEFETAIPLYTHQYERPHNTVLVPCDKLAEMQAEIETLKAHPVKELTDESIITVADPLSLWDVPKDKLIEFARAILRKAQEK